MGGGGGGAFTGEVIRCSICRIMVGSARITQIIITSVNKSGSAALIAAVNEMSEPPFPIVGAAGNLLSPCSRLKSLCALEMPRYWNPSTPSFRQLLFVKPPIKAFIVRVFLDLSELSQTVQYFMGTESYSEQLSALGDCQNWYPLGYSLVPSQ